MKLDWEIYNFEQVSKFSLNQEKLKSKYKQICSFGFISNKTKEGIKELINDLINTTLKETYMGEAIPVGFGSFASIFFKECIACYVLALKIASLVKLWTRD